MVLLPLPPVLRMLLLSLLLLDGKEWFILQNLVDRDCQSSLLLHALRWFTLQAFPLPCVRCWLMALLRPCLRLLARSYKNNLYLKWFLGSGPAQCAWPSLRLDQIYLWFVHVLSQRAMGLIEFSAPRFISPMVSTIWLKISCTLFWQERLMLLREWREYLYLWCLSS